MIKVSSKVKLNMPKIKQLTQAQVTALEQTAKLLHEEVEQAQVFPFVTGNLQNESTFVDDSDSKNGKVSIVSSTPYVRRLYFHPEYHFSKDENPNAKGKWYADWLPGGKEADFAAEAFKNIYRSIRNTIFPKTRIQTQKANGMRTGCRVEKRLILQRRRLKIFTGG